MGQPEQVVASGAARLEGRGVEQRADVAERVPQRPVRLAADQRGALVGRVQAEDDAHRGGLAGAVRADEAGHLAGQDGERHPVERLRRPNRLRSPATSMVASMLDEARFRRGRRSSRRGAVLGVVPPGDVPGASLLRGMAGIPAPGDAVGLGCGDNNCMATGWTQRIATASHSVTVVGVVLAVAALGQAIARAVTLATAHTAQAAPVSTAGEAALYAVPLCLLALATTVPLIFLRPAAAAVAITAASTVSLTVFGSGALTVGGLAAQVLAGYRLGRAGVPGGAGARWDRTQILACGLGVPFLVLALAGHADVPAILLAVLVPAAAWAGIAQRALGEATRHALARELLAGTLAEHMARGERARIARELHDVVAHHISMIAVQAETARQTTPGLPAAGAQRLAEIGDTARAGLTEMRRLLGVLREDARRRGHPAPAARPGAARRADRRRAGDLGCGRAADRVRPGRGVRPERRARRVPDRAGGAHQCPAARARCRRRRRASLRRGHAAAAGPGQRPRPARRPSARRERS